MKLGLRQKLDPSSFMHELHPHSFRKYFFTKLIGAGVDRGVAEYLMGHKFGLDNAYLRMDEEHLRKEYMKAVDDFIFLTDRKLNRESKERVDHLQEQLKRRDAELLETNERLTKLEKEQSEGMSREEIQRVVEEYVRREKEKTKNT
jgi:intergrase/recombinase